MLLRYLTCEHVTESRETELGVNLIIMPEWAQDIMSMSKALKQISFVLHSYNAVINHLKHHIHQINFFKVLNMKIEKEMALQAVFLKAHRL